MHSDLNILGTLSPQNIPRFRRSKTRRELRYPAAKTLAVLSESFDISASFIAGVSTRKKDD